MTLLRSLPLLLATCVAGGLAACGSARPPPGPAGARAGATDAGELYARHCSVCHGARGAGDGLARAFLFPPPRDFTAGRFRLVSAPLGGPSDGDLIAVLRRGMPGSAMPSFAWLEPDELTALAQHVRGLAVSGLAERLARTAYQVGEHLGAGESYRLAERRLAPRAPLALPPEAPVDGPAFERGARLFGENCAPCHGDDGRAEDLAPHWTDEGEFVWARDFTAGVLKGGASYEAIARRVLVGLPGTSMPATALESEADLRALVAYVRSLIPEGAQDRLVQHRRSVQALRVADVDTPGSWQDVPESALVLAPMQWGEQRLLAVRVRARHDGRRLALRLAWQDPVRDVGERSTGAAVDAAAVAFSSEREPPLFGMGSSAHGIDLWHWRADLWTDRAGALDLALDPPHLLRDPLFGESRADVAPRYVPAARGDAPTDEVRGLHAEGAEDLRPGASGLTARAAWEAGAWTLELSGPLDQVARGHEGLAPLQVAFALWNAAPPRGLASKSISIWHELSLDPAGGSSEPATGGIEPSAASGR